VFVATLFDYNGVLVDDENVHLEAFRDVIATLGVTFADADYWSRYIGYDDVGAFRAMLSDAGRDAPEPLLRELVEKKRPVYRQRASKGLEVFPGAAEAVARAARRGPVGVVSGALRDEIELGLAEIGVRAEVRFVVSAEDTREGKPSPEGYEKGLAEVVRLVPGATPGSTLAIEDSLAGVQAAKAAGLVCLAVAHSYGEAELRQAGADEVLARIAEVDDERVRQLHQRLRG
jgi:HAD superfamily hydrolase (TIGR01509 family)